MAKGARTSKKAAVSDLKSRAAELGLPVKQGTVRAVGGRFYLKIGRKQHAIPVGDINSAADVRRLVGQQVYAIASGRNIVAITPSVPIRNPILCYLPAPGVIKEIGSEVRLALINQYVEAKVIPKELGIQLAQALES